MTHTLELAPELEARLQALATQRGTSTDDAIVQVLAEATMSEDELGALEDERDAQFLRERVPAAAADCYSLDDLRRAIGR